MWPAFWVSSLLSVWLCPLELPIARWRGSRCRQHLQGWGGGHPIPDWVRCGSLRWDPFIYLLKSPYKSLACCLPQSTELLILAPPHHGGVLCMISCWFSRHCFSLSSVSVSRCSRMDTVCKRRGIRLRMEGLPRCPRNQYKPLQPGTQIPGASLPTSGYAWPFMPSAPVSGVCGQEERRQMTDLIPSSRSPKTAMV